MKVIKNIIADFVYQQQGRFNAEISEKMLTEVLNHVYQDLYNKNILNNVRESVNIAYRAGQKVFELWLEGRCMFSCNGHHMAQRFADHMDLYDTQLSGQQLYQRLNEWQNLVAAHPLTCNVHSAKKLDVHIDENDIVTLGCTLCAYKQDHVPAMFYRKSFADDVASHKEMMNRLLSRNTNNE